MTWGEFKHAVEQGGAQDTDIVAYIDVARGVADVLKFEVGRTQLEKRYSVPPSEAVYLQID